MPDIHSLISPSYLKIICACSKSLPSDPNYVEEENEQARHGTIQHALLQSKLSTYFGREAEEVDTSELDINEIFEVEEVFGYIINHFNKIKGHCTKPLILIEEKLSLDDFLPSPSWGYIDFGVCTDSTIYVFDAKFGRILVPTEHDKKPNEQLLAYAAGIYFKVKNDKNIKRISLNICQPKLNNYPTTNLSVKKMITFLDEVITPASYKAFNNEGVYTPNESCKYCKNRNHCRAFAAQSIAEMQMMNDPEMLSDEEIDYLLPRIAEFKKWCDLVQSYALKKATDEGVEWKSMVLTTSKPSREFISEEDAINIMKNAGITDIYKTTLLSVAQLEKLIGKQRFKELLGSVVTYKPGKPTLAVRDSKAANNNASSDFKENK